MLLGASAALIVVQWINPGLGYWIAGSSCLILAIATGGKAMWRRLRRDLGRARQREDRA